MGDLYIPVIFKNQQIDVRITSFGFGHAGYIAVNGSTGAASYYEYGRYNDTSDVLLSQEISDFNLSNATARESSLAAALTTLGSRKNVPVQVTFYEVPTDPMRLS